MHRSRFSTVLIDCADDDYEEGMAFWGAALGKQVIPNPDDPRYASLRGRIGGDGGPYVLLQRVAPDERAIHLDLETDDVEAEVLRLEKLGARVKERISNHVVMVAPTGHAFCVVPAYRADFEAHARVWSD